MEKRLVPFVTPGQVRIVEAEPDGSAEVVATMRLETDDERVALHVALALSDLAGHATALAAGGHGLNGNGRTAPRTAVSGPSGRSTALPPGRPGGGLPRGRRVDVGPERFAVVNGYRMGRVAQALMRELENHPDGVNGAVLFAAIGVDRGKRHSVLTGLKDNGFVRSEGKTQKTLWFLVMNLKGERVGMQPEPATEPERAPAE